MTPKEQVQFKILRAIELNPHTSQREIAQMLGVSNGKAHYLVNALIEKGLLKIGSFSRNAGKASKVAYLLTPEGISNRTGLTRSYLARKEAEYEALWAEIKSLRNEDSPAAPELAAADGRESQ
jgi:EPS-associated MarR family transcriptional regulator